MRLKLSLALFALMLCGALSLHQASAADKGKEVSFDKLTSTAPATWESQKPTSRLRFAQFKLPKAEGDKADAEVVIFKGFGGTPKANIDRWKAAFKAPRGKTVDAKVKEMKIAGREVHRVDITGTYLDRPFPASPKVVEKPGYQFVGVQFDAPDNIYHIKFVGPEKTVKKYMSGFNKWLESFK